MNGDKKIGALDALKAILNARQGGGGGQLPPGFKDDIDIDPDLDMPESEDDDTEDPNIKINDPDNVLKDLQDKQNKKKQSGGGGDSGDTDDQDDDEDEDDTDDLEEPEQPAKGGKGDEEDPGDPGDPGKPTKGSKGDKGDSGKSGGQSENDDEDEADQDDFGDIDDQSDQGDPGDPGEQGKSGKSGGGSHSDEKNDGHKASDEFVKEWNETIDQYDRDDVSKADLEKALEEEKNKSLAEQSNAKQSALSAILASKERTLIIDDTVDPRLKMPKNSKQREKKPEDENKADSTEVGKVQDDADYDDPTQIAQDLQSISDEKSYRDLAAAETAEKNELAKAYAAHRNKLKSFDEFKDDLYWAIKSQVIRAQHKEDTYKKINPSYANSSFLAPGQAYPEIDSKVTLNVYIDQSGSWNEADIEKGKDAISSIQDFIDDGLIEVYFYYFADHVHKNDAAARNEGGTGAFKDILYGPLGVENTNAKNVLIITDDDFDRWTFDKPVDFSPLEVPGCVWWLWRKGLRSKYAPKYLIGVIDNFQYNLK